jgi:GH25 family lysozyme M1 (1,4-beta-N-acetylmuramidase)
MKITDRRLYQARNLKDFLFRLDFNDGDNVRRLAMREIAGLVSQGFVAPDKSRIWGVDISGRWDGRVNFAPTVHAGAKFEICKAIDGTVPTAHFAENNQRAITAGLLNGAYAWLYPDRCVSARSQAQAYWDLIRGAQLKIPPAIDLDWTRFAGQQADPNYTDLDKWATEFNRISPTKPILYSASGYMNKFGRMPESLKAKFAGIWIASYGGSQPLMPMGFTQADWDLWQFSAYGDAQLLCPGDLGKLELDLNYMTQEFYEMIGGVIVPPEEPGETPMSQWYQVNVDSLNFRKGPGASYLDIGDLHKDDRIETVDILGGWVKIVKILRVGGAVETPVEAWCSSAYCLRINPPVTQPPPAVTLKHTVKVYSDGSIQVDDGAIVP